MASDISIAARYTKALFQAASAKNEFESIAVDMEHLQKLIKATPLLLDTINNKLVSRSYIEKSIAEIVERTQYNKLTQNFLRGLAKARRLNILPAIFTNFNKLLSLKRGELPAKITSAREVSRAQVARLSKVLSTSFNCKIVPEFKVDPRIIGGLIVNVGSYELDASLRTQLNKLKKTLRID